MADQEWVIVKSRVKREEATALAQAAADTGRSMSALIRVLVIRGMLEDQAAAEAQALG